MNKGFKFVELVMGVLIIGILSAVTIPAYATDVQTLANQLTKASDNNYRLRNSNYTAGQSISSCNDVMVLIGALPVGYTISGGGAPSPEGQKTACTLMDNSGNSVTFFAWFIQ